MPTLLKTEALWDVSLCQLLRIDQHFERLWCVHLPGQAVLEESCFNN